MTALSVVYVFILMVVFLLAGFFLGIIYAETGKEQQHILWRDYLKDKEKLNGEDNQ